MNTFNDNEIWECFDDTPEEFEQAINNACSPNERTFFEKLLYKVVNEVAASNDVLMHDRDNEQGIYILRISDDFLIGKKDESGHDTAMPVEYEGLFTLLSSDMHRFVNRHITVGQWLRDRDYRGINYNGNNDLR